jgi:hypothetical protein
VAVAVSFGGSLAVAVAFAGIVAVNVGGAPPLEPSPHPANPHARTTAKVHLTAGKRTQSIP